MKRVPRFNNGRIRWTSPALQRFIREQLDAGHDLMAIAAMIGATRSAINRANARYGLTTPPSGRVRRADVARDMNLTNEGLRRICERYGIQQGSWGLHRTLTVDDVATIARLYGRTVTERPHGYVTQQELAQAWNEAHKSVSARLKSCPRVTWLRPLRSVYLYDSRDAAQFAPPVAPKGMLRGRVTSPGMAALCGASPAAVARWARKGCPHTKGRRAHYFDPPAVLAWLHTISSRERHRFIAALTAHLAQQEAA